MNDVVQSSPPCDKVNVLWLELPWSLNLGEIRNSSAHHGRSRALIIDSQHSALVRSERNFHVSLPECRWRHVDVR